jgi:regulator of CtrA degradation
MRSSVTNGGAGGGRHDDAIPFVQRHTNSEAFKALFREGMMLVEEAAGYLDGPGRTESKALRRPAALAYATESMRLTTRLMQIASWLLLRRAVNEGELTPLQAQSDRHRVKLARQELSCDDTILSELPPDFVALSERSLRLQARVMHLDRSLSEASSVPAPGLNPLAANLARVEAAFGRA